MINRISQAFEADPSQPSNLGLIRPAAESAQRAQKEKRGISPAKAQRREGKTNRHFERREKSFLDPSHSLGMTGSRLSLGVFAPLREDYPSSKGFKS
ncbi:MAG: hypothetical protein ACREPG_12905, partial [Candidatus Binatia bacterium]